ncbi:outer membrane beta-barrel protein [Niabella sp. 22666]|uniref:outer membrane beta-barrel protein n=1 Tax=Niabella sp. 22666 TaxID=3453954 RepID=UPI003F87A02C
MRSILFILFLLLPVILFAQKEGSVRGYVVSSTDSNALRSATVTVYKKSDSALIGYQITKERGAFEIKSLPLKTDLFVAVTHTGYASFSKAIYLDSIEIFINLQTIGLVKDTGQLLEEVVVKSVAPVTVNGDTLEINPAGIKLDSIEVVDELLSRVPGITRWQDSSLTVNGRKVTKLYVDGRPFFDGSFNMAVKNLPKHAVDKIQVYQEKDIYKQTTADIAKDSTVVMNIKLKPEKRKGYFGNTTALAGTNDSYGGNMSLQLYNKKTHLGFNGSGNIVQRALGDIEPVLQNKDLNIRNNWTIGTTFRQYFKEAPGLYNDRSLHGGYNVSGNRNSSVTNRTTVKNLADSKLTDINEGYNLSRSFMQSVNANYEARKKQQSFSANINFSRSQGNNASNGNITTYRNDSVMASRSANTSQGENVNNQFRLSGNYNNTSVNEGPDAGSLSISYSLNYDNSLSNSTTYSKFESLSDSAYTNLYDRKYSNRNSNFNGNINLNYNGLRQLLFKDHNFWGINIGLNNTTQYGRSDINADVSDRDSVTNSYLTNNNLTNLSGVSDVNSRTGLRLEKMFFKQITDRYQRSIQVSTNLQNQLLYQKNTSTLSYRNRTFIYNFFTPSTNINYNYNKTDQYNIGVGLGHSSSATAPTIDQLYPIQDSAANRYNMIVGNPNLKSKFNDAFNLDLSFNKNRGFEEQRSFNANVNMAYDMERNGIIDSTIYDNDGGRTTYFINTPGSGSFNTGLYMAMSFKFDKTTLQIGAGGGWNTGYTHFATGRGYSNALSGNMNVNVSHALKKGSIQLSYRSDLSDAERPQYINMERLTYNNNNQNHSISLSFNLPGVVEAGLQQAIRRTSSEQAGSSSIYPAAQTRSYNTTARFTLKVPKNFTLGSNVRYSNNISVNAQPIRNINWDANMGYFFPKTKLFEARVSVFNILGQNQNINNYSSGNTTTTSVTQGLQRYFQFTFSYFPRQFGGRAKRSSHIADDAD